jgi:hypothetical protein
MAESIPLKQACIAILMMTGTMTAAPRYIGTVTADGRLWVDSAGVSNHATIFEGSVIETEEVPAKLRLTSGTSVWLDTCPHVWMCSMITCFCGRVARNSTPDQHSESKPGHCVSPWPRPNLGPSSAYRIPAPSRSER